MDKWSHKSERSLIHVHIQLPNLTWVCYLSFPTAALPFHAVSDSKANLLSLKFALFCCYCVFIMQRQGGHRTELSNINEYRYSKAEWFIGLWCCRLFSYLSSSRRRLISSSSSRWRHVPSDLIFSKWCLTSSLHSAWWDTWNTKYPSDQVQMQMKC